MSKAPLARTRSGRFWCEVGEEFVRDRSGRQKLWIQSLSTEQVRWVRQARRAQEALEG